MYNLLEACSNTYNTVDLLRHYIQHLVSERVRPSAFNIETFRKLEWREMFKYLETHLKKLGKGSSRYAYLYSSSWVIKFAFNKAGTGQNVQEKEVFDDYDTKPLVAKIRDWDEQARWSLSELVRPLSNDDEFYSLTGINKGKNYGRNVSFDWGSSIKEIVNAVVEMDEIEVLQRALVTLPKPAQLKIAALWHGIYDMNLIPGDLSQYSHWGKTTTGDVVLLDYGYSNEVHDTHYNEDGTIRKDDDDEGVQNS